MRSDFEPEHRTVPENFRATLSAWGVWSYLVVLFERNPDGSFRRPADYPERAIATFNTHDLPTFAGWISGTPSSRARTATAGVFTSIPRPAGLSGCATTRTTSCSRANASSAGTAN